MSAGEPAPQATPVTVVDLGARALVETLPLVTELIGRALAGEAIDLVTDQDLVVKYVVPTAAVEGAKASFRRRPEGGWRIELRPRARAARGS